MLSITNTSSLRPSMESTSRRSGSYQLRLAIKRALDIVFSAVILIVLSPIFAIVALAVLMSMGRPVFFKQVRPGYRAELFPLLKFRTMRDAIGLDGKPLPDGERLTATGRFLRRASLDELPQLWNVLRGQMSLVGPRPLLMEYLDLYSDEQMRRHDVKPGITGLAQVSGRNLIDWNEKFSLDVWYAENWTLCLDLRILMVTVWKVLNGEGISSRGAATAPQFTRCPESNR